MNLYLITVTPYEFGQINSAVVAAERDSDAQKMVRDINEVYEDRDKVYESKWIGSSRYAESAIILGDIVY